MSTPRFLGGLTAGSVFLMTGTAGFAEVTAQQVWDDWSGYLESFGYGLSATESASGGDLVVSDIAMTIKIPEEDAELTLTMGDLTFSDNGDGTVGVSFPASMPVTISGSGPEGPGSVTLDYATQGFAMNVSGDPGNMVNTYSAASIAMTLREIMVGSQAVDLGTASMEMTKLSGSTEMKVGNIRESIQKMISGPVTYALDFTDPDNGNRIVLNGMVESLDMTADVSIPLGLDMTDMAAALKAGLALSGGYEFGPGNMSFNSTESGETMQGKSSSQGGGLSVAMSEDELAYALRSRDVQMEFAGGDIPFPIALAAAEAGFDLEMPVSAGEDPQPFKLGMIMGDFTMSDFIWGIFDPGAQLPRDPATIDVELTGKTTLFTDIMDPEAMEGAEAPGELNALTLNRLLVRAVGAELTGSGDLAIDNSDMTSYDGMPKPVGAVDLNLKGANGLMDTLVAMGLLPEEQAMGARMMMGMFAVPGDGEDSLKSRIEFNEEGQVLANGQRLK